MSPAGRDLAVWGGGTWALVVAGLVVLFWRGSTLDQLANQDNASYGDYHKLYHPDDPNVGVYVQDAEADLTRTKENQGHQLEIAEAELVPPLPDSYRQVVDKLTENESIISSDQSMLNNEAMSRGVILAAKAPYGTLDQDTRVRGRQMAELYLYRLVIHACIEAKVKRVNAVKVLAPSIDPTQSYQLYSCEFGLDTSFESGQRLLEALAAAAKQGISLAFLRITPSLSDPSQREVMSFIATLIVPLQGAGARPRAGGP